MVQAIVVGAERMVFFDVFTRPTFVRRAKGLSQEFKLKLASLEAYRDFLIKNFERYSGHRQGMS
jgi:hypothetical protein